MESNYRDGPMGHKNIIIYNTTIATQKKCYIYFYLYSYLLLDLFQGILSVSWLPWFTHADKNPNHEDINC